MAINIAPRQKRLLKYLQQSIKPVSTKDLESALNYNYQVLVRDLRSLTELRLIKRIPGPGHSYKYKFISWDEEPTGSAARFVKASPQDVKKFIQTVTQQGWEPNFSKPEMWGMIVQAMLDLHTMFMKLSEGDKINQDQLDRTQAELREPFKYLEFTTNYIGRMLATEELWDRDRLGEYLSE